MVLQWPLIYLKRYCKVIWNKYSTKKNRPHNLEECMNPSPKSNIWRHWCIIIAALPIIYYIYCCYPYAKQKEYTQHLDEFLPSYFDLNVRSASKLNHPTEVPENSNSEFIGRKPPNVVFNNTPFIKSSHKIIKLNKTKVRGKDQLQALSSPLTRLSTTRRIINKPENYCYYNKTGLGPISVNKSRMVIEEVDKRYPNVGNGGHYMPANCLSRHKVAIFIPYRNRTTNLAIFLYNIHPFLMKQQVEYRIFIIEQNGSEHFNKGRLYNAAFMESQKYGEWKCYMFHDVDLLPLDLRIVYSCPTWPRHMSATIQETKAIPKYHVLFGGVTVMSGDHFKKANGYSNAYWGWGGEDHDMFWRLRSKQINVVRYNRTIAVYTALPHTRGTKNPYRYFLLTSAILRPEKEGLNTVDYKLLNITVHHLYTHILVDVNPYREDIKETTIELINHYLADGVGMKLPKRLL